MAGEGEVAWEEERKFDVDPSFTLPELAGCLPPDGCVHARPPVTLTATYYDTADLRLARAGASLRHRRGDEPPWTVKLPSGVPGVRQEVSRPGGPTAPPGELVALVTAYTLGAAVTPVATLRTVRRAYDLCDHAGRVLAEVADDTVTTTLESADDTIDDTIVQGAGSAGGEQPPATFREIEVERRDGDPTLLDKVGRALRDAGATTGAFTPKHVRALGRAAGAPPALVAPGPLGAHPRAGDVVTEAIRSAAARVVNHDPPLRLDQALPGGDTAVHQMRVGCRRLRSDLRTFADAVQWQWAQDLRREVRWLGRTLGAARDAEVLRARLERTAGMDALAPCDPEAVARLDEMLAARQRSARAKVAGALTSSRYVALLERIHEAASRPRLTTLAGVSAQELLPRLVAAPWHALVHGTGNSSGAAGLSLDAPDSAWHAVRVRCKRARYAVEAVSGVVGEPAQKLARRLSALQDLLGEHQDAAVAADTWLSLARDAGDHPVLAVTAGRLYERERLAVRHARQGFPARWQAANEQELLAWLPSTG